MSDGLPLGTYATTAGRTNAPISDVLLEALGIPALRIPRSRLRPTSASSRLSFFDTYAYLYLAQTEIDRSVVGHLDSYRDPKRRAAFELLYGLSNAALMDLQVQRGELRDALANRQRQASENPVDRSREDGPPELESAPTISAGARARNAEF